jgi:DNA-binding IclR family transcriptional regulator
MSSKLAVSPYRVQVLDRALGILDLLSSEGPEVPLTELSGRLKLHKSTVHRLLMVLERHRLVERESATGKYRLGLKLFELGSKAVAHVDLGERARPSLKRLVFETGETAHLCILDRGEVLSLANVESPRTIRTPSTVGRRTAAHCTASGKVLLAHLPEEDLNDLINQNGLTTYTRNTITVPAELKSELQKVRDRGWALDNEEIEDNLKCIGAPVRNHSGRVVASISIAGPAFRLTAEKSPVLAQLVVKIAEELSAELGYSPPSDNHAFELPRSHPRSR